MINPCWKKMLWLTLSLGVLNLSCGPQGQTRKDHQWEASSILPLDYATGFKVQKSNDANLVVIENPGIGLGDSLTYALIPSGTDPSGYLWCDQVIEVPVERLVVTSTSHVPFLDLLNTSKYLVGFPNTQYISSESMRSRIDQNLVKEVGTATGLDYESLIELQPELVVSYVSGVNQDEFKQLNQSKIPTVLILDFMEETPLARAEWIKFMGLLVGRAHQADSVFKTIEKEYNRLVLLAKDQVEKPTVFSGILYGDTWFAPGGRSFVASFIEDAGGQYTWIDQKTTGSAELSFEAVVDRNLKSDYWIGVGGFIDKKSLHAADSRYSHFSAFQKDHVFNYHGRIGATGGFEYLELGGARPDLVLADLIMIIHPELVTGYQSTFFKKLD